jgi:hypothetical protein
MYILPFRYTGGPGSSVVGTPSVVMFGNRMRGGDDHVRPSSECEYSILCPLQSSSVSQFFH